MYSIVGRARQDTDNETVAEADFTLEVCPEVSALQMLHKSIHRIRYDEMVSRTVWFCFSFSRELVSCYDDEQTMDLSAF